MEAKHVFAGIFLIIVLGLMTGYYIYFFSSEDLEFTANPKNYNFSLEAANNSSMQFYNNLRFPTSDITYRIEHCTKKKSQDMRDAFAFMGNITILRFNEVNDNEQIYVTCNETAKFKENLFVAGEGGPSSVVRSGEYNVINKGEILLIQDSSCQKPNVAIHELLHVLGFKHSGNNNNIMYPISNCAQTVGEEIPQLINNLYSIESLPDLVFENVSAYMHGRMLDINISVRNIGLNTANPSIIEIILDNKQLRQVELSRLEAGGGKLITITNIFVTQFSLDEIELYIDSSDRELDKKNNNITLELAD